MDELVPEVNNDLAAYWEVWAGPIGRTVQPVLEDLQRNLPGPSTALAFTLAGQAICQAEMDDSEAARICALAASAYALFGTASSRASNLAESPTHVDSINLTYGNSQAVIVAVKDLIVGSILVWVSAEGVNLGVLAFQTKAGADTIRRLLAIEEAHSIERASLRAVDEPPHS